MVLASCRPGRGVRMIRSRVSKSTATQEDVQRLSKSANASWWAKNKERILGK